MALPNYDFDYKPQKPTKFQKWVPKKWRPEYERIVALSAVGKSNTEIADIVGFGKQHVSNVLNLPQADELMKKIVEAMTRRSLVDIPNSLQRIAEKTVQRLEVLMDNDKLFNDSPFAVIDRGMKVVEGLRHLQGGGNGAPTMVNNGKVVNNTFNVPATQVDSLIAGLQKANEVKQIHAPRVEDT